MVILHSIYILTVMRKYTDKQKQLCKILSSLSSPQTQNTLPSIEFDDKLISRSPQTRLAHRARPSLLSKGCEDGELDKRKERIKQKIKSQIKTRLEQRCNQLVRDRSEDTPSSGQINQRSSNLIAKANSQIMWRRNFLPKGKMQDPLPPEGCSAGPWSRKSLQIQDYVQRKSIFIRTRSLKSNHNDRRSQEGPFGKVGLRQTKMMCQQVCERNQHQQLNPWKYGQEHDTEYPIFMRKRYLS